MLGSYKYLIVPISIGLLLPAFAVPWVAINFLGYRAYAPLDIMAGFAQTPDAAGRQIDISLLRQNGPTVAASIASMSLFVLAIAFLLAAIPLKRHRTRLALVGGILAIGSGVLWIYAIESLKDSIARAAAVTGGIIGEEFRGRENDLADLFIIMGIGHYLVMAAGALSVSNYLAELHARARQIPSR
ncbi:MAG: hypothetical protein ACREAY_11410 [Nitrososphaera sp.]|uniref:hypothetical protein n=1 Tax=Nitrososphaera sp. TaxID=1971748 RepID=UPI003D6F9E43